MAIFDMGQTGLAMTMLVLASFCCQKHCQEDLCGCHLAEYREMRAASVFFLLLMKTEPRSSHMLGKYFMMELYTF